MIESGWEGGDQATWYFLGSLFFSDDDDFQRKIPTLYLKVWKCVQLELPSTHEMQESLTKLEP